LFFHDEDVHQIFHLPTQITRCDSILRLDVRVHDTIIINITDTLFLYRELFYPFKGRELTEPDVYTDTVFTECGECPSIITILNLRVFDAIEVQRMELAEICDNQSSFILEYDILAGDIISFSALFNTRANEAGFVDIDPGQGIVNIVGNTAWIEILIPPDVVPDIYSVILTLETAYNGNHIDTIPFMIRYSSDIIRQKWHDVLILRNIYSDRFQFSSFQWYRNDERIPGATRSYVHVSEGLDLGAEYRVAIVRAGETRAVFTCPITPEWRDRLWLAPTIISQGEVVAIGISTAGHAVVSNVMGIRVSEHALQPGTNQINMQVPQGTYFVTITDEAGDQRTYTVLVK
jgi:hypothetical protein